MLYSMLLVTITFITTSWASSSCGLDDQNMMQDMFSNCTQKWKTEYNMAVAVKKKEVQSVTCRLVENIVETCGDEWRQCHGEEDVRRMKDMHVESLLHKNRGVVVDIEQCHTVKQFRSRSKLGEEDPVSCSDEESIKSQKEFQTCTHSITTTVNDKIQSLNSVKSISNLLCQAINNIHSQCVKHLEKCLDVEDVIILSENHIEQLKAFFVNLAGDKVDSDFGLDNCQEVDDSVAIDKETRKTFDDNLIAEAVDNKERETATKEEVQGATNKDVELQQDNDAEYVNDEQDKDYSNTDLTDSDGEIKKEPVKLVSNKKYDITSSSKNLQLNYHFFIILCFSLFVRNIVK